MYSKDIEEVRGSGPSANVSRERQNILVVGTGAHFSQDIMTYALHLAERLDYALIVLSVGPAPDEKDFERKARAAAKEFKQKADLHGIHCEHVMKFGDLEAAIKDLNHQIKRIEFMVAGSEVNKDEITRAASIPLFRVISQPFNFLNTKGGSVMTSTNETQKRRPWGKTIGYGLVSAALYAGVFTDSDTIMHYFTKGGLYAALPIATVFVFSFAHGAFASNLWSLLGIEARKRDALRATETKVLQERKPAPKKPQTYVYINTFHRL